MPTPYESLKETYKNLCAEKNRRTNSGESCSELITQIEIIVGRMAAIERRARRAARYLPLLMLFILPSCQAKHCWQCTVDNVPQSVCGETKRGIEKWKEANSKEQTYIVSGQVFVTTPVVECSR